MNSQTSDSNKKTILKVALVGTTIQIKEIFPAFAHFNDLECVAVYGRNGQEVAGELSLNAEEMPLVKSLPIQEAKDQIDLLLVVGDETDYFMEEVAEWVRGFHVVDNFDRLEFLDQHIAQLDKIARDHQHLALVGIKGHSNFYEIVNHLAQDLLPDGKSYHFVDYSVNQALTQSISQMEGVKEAQAYTVALSSAISAVWEGASLEETDGGALVQDGKQIAKQGKKVYLVAEEGADRAEIQKAIAGLPVALSDQDLEVEFVSHEAFTQDHQTDNQSGVVIRTQALADQAINRLAVTLDLDQAKLIEPRWLLTHCRAAGRMIGRGEVGAYTSLDVRPSDRQ